MSLNTRANFLMVVSIIFAVYSLLWGLAPFAGFNIPARLILDFSDWPIDNLSAPLDKNTMWPVQRRPRLCTAPHHPPRDSPRLQAGQEDTVFSQAGAGSCEDDG